MGNKKIRIIWDKIALQDFEAIIRYIGNDSVQSAEKVGVEISEKIERLADYPEMYPPDKYKLNNDGNYRAFECQRLRVSYCISTVEIIILRIRHTGREPLTY